MGPFKDGRPPRCLSGAVARALTVAGAAALAAASPLTAQILAGSVLEASTGRHLVGARITLLDSAQVAHATALADSLGEFALDVPGAGTWHLSVDLLGYQPMVSDPIVVAPAELVVVEITLDVHAIPLEPLVVTTRRSMRTPDIQAFYDRMERAGRGGFGSFVAREDIDRGGATRPTDLIRSMAGVRIVRGIPGRGAGIRMAGGCVPAIFIDGMRINRISLHDSLDDYVTTLDIEGIEVYRGPMSQLGALHDPSGCGLIAVWTRRGEVQPGGGFSWRKLLTAAGIIGILLFVMN
jgi:hypothetical protein